jgi:predicted dehydrogenase
MLANRQPDGQFEIGVVGAGNISTVYHLPTLDTIENVRIKHLADISKQNATGSARHHAAEAVHLGDEHSIFPGCGVVLLIIPVGVREQYVEPFTNRWEPVRKTSILPQKSLNKLYNRF